MKRILAICLVGFAIHGVAQPIPGVIQFGTPGQIPVYTAAHSIGPGGSNVVVSSSATTNLFEVVSTSGPAGGRFFLDTLGGFNIGTNGWRVTIDGNQNYSGLWDRFVGPLGLTNSNTEKVIYTNNIPAHALGPNGVLRFTVLGTCASVTAGAVINLRLGGGSGTIVAAFAYPSSASTLRSEWEMREVYNQNSEAVQVSWASTSATFGDSGNVLFNTTVDTTTNLPIALTLASNNALGTNSISSAMFEIYHK